MCEQLGKEPDPDKCPPDLDDLPEPMVKAIIIFNMLGDRVVPDVGYLGKDYTALPVFMKAHAVTSEKIFLETLARLDAQLIKKSGEQLKKARDAAKRK